MLLPLSASPILAIATDGINHAQNISTLEIAYLERVLPFLIHSVDSGVSIFSTYTIGTQIPSYFSQEDYATALHE